MQKTIIDVICVGSTLKERNFAQPNYISNLSSLTGGICVDVDTLGMLTNILSVSF